MDPNRYTSDWFRVFLPPDAVPAPGEIAFIERNLPKSEYPRLLDVCCGVGRHGNALAERGYQILGIDRDPAAVEAARSAAPAGATYQVLAMEELSELPRKFDGVLSLWASFGFDDEETNLRNLRQMAGRLRPDGRLLLDVYNREALPALPTRSTVERNGLEVRITRSLDGNLFRVVHEYLATGNAEVMEWWVYSPGELEALGVAAGLRVSVGCAWFDEARSPSSAHARMQLVLLRD